MLRWFRSVKDTSRTAFVFLLACIIGSLAAVIICLVLLPPLVGLPITLAVIAVGVLITALIVFFTIN